MTTPNAQDANSQVGSWELWSWELWRGPAFSRLGGEHRLLYLAQ
jgi:hypothetical protein